MSTLDTIVAKFRKGSPNIAAAFDEVQRRLVALEAGPPPPVFGTDPRLARMPASTGPETVCTSWAQLKAKVAVANPGDRIRIQGRIDPGSDIQVSLTRPGTPTQPITLCGAGSDVFAGRVLPQSDWWNIDWFRVETPRYDAIKIADGKPANHVQISRMYLHPYGTGSLRGMGILSGFSPSSDIRVFDTEIDGTGGDGDALGPHGIYTGGPTSDWVIANVLVHDMRGFGFHFYPSPKRILWTGCTLDGGDVRGGVAYGADATDIVGVGSVITGSPVGAFEYRLPGTGTQVFDIAQWGNAQGLNGTGYPPVPATNVRAANAPDLVQPERYSLLPATFIDGSPRLSGWAGANPS